MQDGNGRCILGDLGAAVKEGSNLISCTRLYFPSDLPLDLATTSVDRVLLATSLMQKLQLYNPNQGSLPIAALRTLSERIKNIDVHEVLHNLLFMNETGIS